MSEETILNTSKSLPQNAYTGLKLDEEYTPIMLAGKKYPEVTLGHF